VFNKEEVYAEFVEEKPYFGGEDGAGDTGSEDDEDNVEEPAPGGEDGNADSLK
jgi:hypothetical protein